MCCRALLLMLTSLVLAPMAQALSLAEVRVKAPNTIHWPASDNPVPAPPAGDLEIVHYPAPLGENVAYASPVQPGTKRPAILWVQGGFGWGIDESAWIAGPPEDDQSARAFRDAGIVQMYAALRGWNGNPGQPECMYGEIDDLIAAGKWLASRPDVDPTRVYLGGHSTGGTQALLLAASTDLFRAIFAFGPVADVRHYGEECIPQPAAEVDWVPRAPWLFAARITTPTWIVEGRRQGNIRSIKLLMTVVGDAPVTFVPVRRHDHFSVLSPGVKALASAIVADTEEAVLPRLTETLERLR